MAGADPEDIHGWRVSELVPRPVPFRFRMLDAEERGWRGRAAIRLWLMGFPVRTVWLQALSEDAGRRSLDLVEDRGLAGEVLRRRLMDVVGTTNGTRLEGLGTSFRLDTTRTL